MPTAALAFAGAAALINVTPGLDTLLVLRTSLTHGKPTGLAAALGILLGCLAWGVAAAVGLTAVLTASHVAYDTLRIVGAAYLTWLGISALRRAGGRRKGLRVAGPAASPSVPPAQPSAPVPYGRLAAFRSGLGTNLLNPKAGIFYMSLVPQFIPHGAPVFGATMLLTAIDLAELTLWYWVVSGAAAALSERIGRQSFRRRTEQASGVVFLGFAANLLTERA